MKHLSTDTQSALFEAMLDGSRVATTVTDPQQLDNPIIYTNLTFEKLTGYSREEIIGKNCRFLQGSETNQDAVQQIREAIASTESVTVVLRNFRKDGTPFWNRLNIEPVTIENHLYFIGTQTDVSIQENQRLLLLEQEDEINRLMLPILTIHDNLGAVTLVGKMNDERFSILTDKLSEYVQKNAVGHIIIDISGVLWEGNSFIHRLLMIQDVLRLMGGKLYVTGINAKAAIEISNLSMQSPSLTTFSTVRQAIEYSTGVNFDSIHQ
ncbi:PAS domain-containing protein [Planococcus sp. CAU13]|uniref:PAS domain-containing protein n=1 Tax=Planococcus sp. CAU13 TaxID=1541197 RepID=UPI00052FFB74|nr:PAS domain-containing protein [Planococcus sp. CAU13]